MSQQVRFAPSSLDVVYWKAGRITVDRDGRDYDAAAGHHPAWISASDIAWCPPEDGVIQSTMGEATPVLSAGNTLTAAAGKVAVHRTDPRRVLTSWGPTVWEVTDPVLSADGRWMAMLCPDKPQSGQCSLSILDVAANHLRGLVYVGAAQRPRFSHTGTSLCWQDGGAIYGIADVTNPSSPVQRLSRPGDPCSHPVPLWAPGVGLFVLYVQDRGAFGVLMLAEWGSAAAQQPMGYVLVASSGSGYDHDVRESDGRAAYAWLTPDGRLDRSAMPLDTPLRSLPLPPAPEPEPEPPPDTPFVVDPTGVVEDVAAWLFSPNQGPDVHLSPDGLVRFFCKSDERSGDGPDPQIGEHWDVDATYIGHLEDASMGRRVYQGKAVSAETIVKLFPDTHAAVWASLPLYRNWWAAGARVWLPRRCVSGYSLKYTTDFLFNTGEKHPDVLIEIRVDVGRGVMHGKEVRVRGAYISSPDGGETWNAEVNYFTEPHGFNAWVGGPYPDNEPHWLRAAAGVSPRVDRWAAIASDVKEV